MISWKLMIAVFIGAIFVYLTNRKTKKKLQNHFESKQEEKDHESIYKNRR